MEVIQSFTINHMQLKPGIYVSRQMPGITTFDIRMTEPNHEPAIGVAAMHTIEHLIATFLRNEPGVKEDVVYWGPMGCLTGCYLIMTGSWNVEQIRQLMLRAYQYVATYTDEVPGTTPETCGNYLMHDLPMARYEAKRYIDRLQNDFHCTYSTLQLTTNDGKQFQDS